MILLAPYIHPTAEISAQAQIGAGTRIAAQSQVREFAIVGERCDIGKGVFIDSHVRIGSNVKIQNYVSLYEGITIDDGVFIGPQVCFTNDLFPRAVNLDGTVKSIHDWDVTTTHIEYGVSVEGGAVVRCGVSIGRFALVTTGAVVTRDVPPHALVVGNPARPQGYVCQCAFPLERVRVRDGRRLGFCARCDREYDITP